MANLNAHMLRLDIGRLVSALSCRVHASPPHTMVQWRHRHPHRPRKSIAKLLTAMRHAQRSIYAETLTGFWTGLPRLAVSYLAGRWRWCWPRHHQSTITIAAGTRWTSLPALPSPPLPTLVVDYHHRPCHPRLTISNPPFHRRWTYWSHAPVTGSRVPKLVRFQGEGEMLSGEFDHRRCYLSTGS